MSNEDSRPLTLPPPPDAEALYECLATQLADLMFIVELDGRLSYLSPAAETMLGWRPEEIVGRHYLEMVLPQSIDHATEVFRSAVEDNAHLRAVQILIRKRDGSVLAGEVNASRFTRGGVAQGVMGLIRDVSERQRSERALRESEERYRVLFSGINDAVFVHEVRDNHEPGRFLQVNDVACRRLGYTRDELLAMTPRDITTHDAFQRTAPLRRDLTTSGNGMLETIHVTKDGRQIPVESNIHSFQYLGRPAALSISRDITERRRAEDERIDMERRMLHVQKLESLGVLAGGIAHDFNNILVAILGYADLALSDLPPASPVRDSIGEIENASRRAADLCRQMLAYSGRGKFVVEPIGLGQLVSGMVHLTKASLSKHTTLRLHADAILPPIDGDATQLRQVVMNLVTNASEALGDSGGVVEVSTSLVHLTRDALDGMMADDDVRAGHFVCLEVKDTGCGMSEETQARLFEPFFTTKFTGRGLGMAAVLGIVRGHRGAIRIQSTPGVGTAFYVYFPVSSSATTLRLTQANRAAAVPATYAGGCVLVVDDEEIVRDVARAMLQRAGFDVITAADGTEGVEQVIRQRERISLVLLDLMMPGMDGDATFTALQQLSPEIPVLMSSGYTEQEITSRLAGRGLAGFVQKPYSQADLLSRVREALARAHPEALGSV